MGFLDIMGLKYNTGIAYVNIFNDGRFNSSMWKRQKSNLNFEKSIIFP
jgi:hypothetical protein